MKNDRNRQTSAPAETADADGEAPVRQTRNREETQERILQAAIEEFCAHGYAGANTTRIVKAAGCNIRMLYHYFESKNGLYLSALARVYQELRSSEDATHFDRLEPREGVIALTHFTFDYMHNNPQFPKMIINENINMGRAAGEISESIKSTSKPFIDKIDALLRRGQACGAIPKRVDAFHLYLTILALSFIHISNAYTLPATFGVDVGSKEFLEERKRHVTRVVLGYLDGADTGR